MKKVLSLLFVVALVSVSVSAYADGHVAKTKVVDMYMLVADKADGMGAKVGTVTITETPEGLLFKADVKGLPAGQHGFHIHQNPAVGPKEVNGKMVAGMQAGGHFDPGNTGVHLGPHNPAGHLGDLPVLHIDAKGNAPLAVLAPRIKKISEITNRSLMIHVDGDNYSDIPKVLGGGGARLAAGIIK